MGGGAVVGAEAFFGLAEVAADQVGELVDARQHGRVEGWEVIA